ncbi:MAG: cation-translocating P-type ATPase C-terminal domain-containing protein, partial [Clostridium sp.]
IAIFTLTSFYIGLNVNPAVGSTMAFATLCLSRLFHGFNCRGKNSIFTIGIFSNRYSWMAFGLGLVFLNSVLFVPFLQNLFEVATLTGSQVGYIYLLSFLPTVIIQITKVIIDTVNNKKTSI